MRLGILAGLVVATAVVGCGQDSASGNDPISVDEIEGEWAWAMTRAEDCDGGGPDGAMLIRLSIAGSTGTSASLEGSAWFVDGTRVGDLTGAVDLVSGLARMDLWNVTNVSGALFEGKITSSGTMSGTLTDPSPGFGAIWAIVRCTWHVRGDHS